MGVLCVVRTNESLLDGTANIAPDIGVDNSLIRLSIAFLISTAKINIYSLIIFNYHRAEYVFVIDSGLNILRMNA